MTNKFAFPFFNLFFMLSVCSTVNGQAVEDKPIFHYSVMDAMRNGVYTGALTIDALAAHGNFGLGTYNQLDGEMVALDGGFYRVAPDGGVAKAEAQRKVPFASVAFFKADQAFELNNIQNIEMLQQEIMRRLPSKNKPYLIRIESVFRELNVGGANKLTAKDTTGLAELMKSRPLYKKQDVAGTIVGFYHPAYASGIDLSPFHFHFISNDKTYGGHIVTGELSSAKIKVSIDEKPGYQVMLPEDNETFNRPWSTPDQAKGTY